MELAEMQSVLRADEAYVKMVSLDDEALMLTFPFDIEASRDLHNRLFAPVADRLTRTRHIVFEPDGAMLKLASNLLVTDDESVSRYLARLDGPDADDFDFRGVAWLGRNSRISTSVAPNAFRDVRAAPSSDAGRAYLGLGENVPVRDTIMPGSGETCLTSGGDFALDGLVRAFVGAGGRTVLASHWPVPDTFDATERLISGLFVQYEGATAEAFRRSQLELMAIRIPRTHSTGRPLRWWATERWR